MSEDARQEAERRKKDARQEAERRKQQAEFLVKDPELQEESIRQDNLIYAGLVGVGIVMVQPFLIAESLDRSGMICVVSWSVAIPLLAALLMVNRQEAFRRRRTDSRTVVGARAIALLAATVGLVAGFWHIHWIAGVAVLVSALVATGVHSAGFTRLELGVLPARRETQEDVEAPAFDEAEDPRPGRHRVGSWGLTWGCWPYCGGTTRSPLRRLICTTCYPVSPANDQANLVA